MNPAKQVGELKKLFKQCLPLFNALGDSTRQQLILLLMNDKQRSVEELTSETTLSRPTVSHHLKILKDAGLIAEQKKGRKHYYLPCSGEHLERVEQLIAAVRDIEQQKGTKQNG